MAKTTKRTTKPAARKPKTAARKTAPKVAAPPRTLHTITSYLSVNDAAAAIEWYKKAFNAKEATRQMVGPKVMHAALRIGDSEIYLSDIFPGSDMRDPSRVGASVTMQVRSKD